MTVPASLVTAMDDHVVLIAAIGVCLLLTPIAIYLAVREPRT